MPERFLVFIPAYNCEKQVPRVLNQLLDRQVAAMVTECIVVNNRSTDGTEAAVQSWLRFACCATTRTMAWAAAIKWHSSTPFSITSTT